MFYIGLRVVVVFVLLAAFFMFSPYVYAEDSLVQSTATAVSDAFSQVFTGGSGPSKQVSDSLLNSDCGVAASESSCPNLGAQSASQFPSGFSMKKQIENLCEIRKAADCVGQPPDGIHYSGKKSQVIAKTWANKNMNEIQGKQFFL